MATPAINSIVKAEQRPDHQDVCAAQYELRPTLIRSRPFRGERRRETQTEPLRRLMSAVLCEAVDRFQRNLSQTSLYSRCEFVEGEFWLFKDQGKALFSFNNVCDFLSLDPQHIKKAAQQQAPVPYASPRFNGSHWSSHRSHAASFPRR